MSEPPLSYEQTFGNDHPPEYHADFSQIYPQWKKSVKAALEADELAVRLASAKSEMATSMKVLKQLKEKSSDSFQLLHKKKSSSARLLLTGPRFLARRQSSAPTTLEETERAAAEAEFKRARQEEDEQARMVADLDDDIGQMSLKKESLDAFAAMAEEFWIALSSSDEAIRLVPAVRSVDVSNVQAEIDALDSAFRDASTISADLARAQLAASNAHRYLTIVLHCCDNLNTGGNASVLSEGFRGGLVNMLKQYDYVRALGEGKKAQACLDEAFRVLEPHRDMLPITLLGDYDALRSSGVHQISKVYHLLYNGNPHANTIRPLVRTMLEKQETAFSHLTNIAVWVQDTVPSYEAEERQARVQRDAARAKLADIWKGFSLPSQATA